MEKVLHLDIYEPTVIGHCGGATIGRLYLDHHVHCTAR